MKSEFKKHIQVQKIILLINIFKNSIYRYIETEKLKKIEKFITALHVYNEALLRLSYNTNTAQQMIRTIQ